MYDCQGPDIILSSRVIWNIETVVASGLLLYNKNKTPNIFLIWLCHDVWFFVLPTSVFLFKPKLLVD